MCVCVFVSKLNGHSSIMREYPITVHTPNVYHINSNTSNLYDDHQYQRKLSSIETDANYQPYHQQSHQRCNNKNATNYIYTSNGDLTSHRNTANRMHHFNNNKCNRTSKNHVKPVNPKNVTRGDFDGIEDDMDDQQSANRNGSYSILNAITNAVTTGNCTNTIYPANKRNDPDFDQITLDPDQFTDSTQIHNLKNAQSSNARLNHSNGQYPQYNHYDIDIDRPHQFPSVNYKHSYLLWIGTPVAARYIFYLLKTEEKCQL